MEKKEAKEGNICCFYADKSFLKVKQAFGIDRICFSFVKKGTKGSGQNIYMTIDEFDLLCDSILSLNLFKKISAEKQKNAQFPGAYVYVTGKDGTKKICIGAGKSNAADAVCIQGVGPAKDGKKDNIFVGTTYKELVIMARWWNRISKPYYDDMVNMIYSAEMRRPSEEELSEISESSTAPSPERKEKPEPTHPTRVETEQEQSKSVKPKPTEQPRQEIKLLSVVNTTPLEPLKSGSGYACQLEKGGKKIAPLVFYNAVVEKISGFQLFKEQLEESNSTFSVVAIATTIKEKNVYEFVRFLN